MMRPDVVDYLRANLPTHSPESLRTQLRLDGISDVDFDDSLAETLKAPQTTTPRRGMAAKWLLVAAMALFVGAALLILSQKTSTPPTNEPVVSGSGESGFVGARGWVVRLPKDYIGVSQFKDGSKTVEIVHFCKRGTDPTNFLDEGLFGQLGIVRLTVMPSEFPGNPTGAVNLANAVARKISSHGEKFTIKNIQIATLPGVQVNISAPFPRLEAYVLGQNDLYFFYAGQEDAVWRDIVLSLRDVRSEN